MFFFPINWCRLFDHFYNNLLTDPYKLSIFPGIQQYKEGMLLVLRMLIIEWGTDTRQKPSATRVGLETFLCHWPTLTWGRSYLGGARKPVFPRTSSWIEERGCFWERCKIAEASVHRGWRRKTEHSHPLSYKFRTEYQAIVVNCWRRNRNMEKTPSVSYPYPCKDYWNLRVEKEYWEKPSDTWGPTKYKVIGFHY